ncbi:MAG TPA: hydroxysqualene dehydroxylase HpnE [Silvibacterium sp.]|nr:hydroxysqualene dehydroxylase HpnE [Silvibacterium sp.]
MSAPRSIVVIGGGLAGLSAACALADSGLHVQLLERRPYVGGRASSYEHPGTGEVIDNCQHVLIGRCTNLIDLYRRLDALDAIRWYDHFTFIEPGGRRTLLQPSSLPAPLHTSLSFLGAPAFSIADKLAIVRGMFAFLTGIPEDTDENFAHWLTRHGQTPRAIQRFWHPVLVSALNEDLDRISVKYAGKVFRESFLLSPEAGRMGIPGIPLSDLYGRAIDYLRARGGEVHLRTSVEAIEEVDSEEPEIGWVIRSGDRTFMSDAVILALSFEALASLLPALPRNPQSGDLAADLAQFEHSPITGIHLWFDREITDLEHAVLLDSTIQWVFNKSKLQPAHRTQQGSYVELVVSSSKSLVPLQRQEIIDLALRELARFFPAVSSANLEKATVVKEVRATYSVRPLLDRIRPGVESPWPGIYLAGDWTATGWPSTMEGAVRSGYLAAEAFTRDAGEASKFLVPDLPHAGLMRLFR